MSNYSHGVLTGRASRKRKERENIDGVKTSIAGAGQAESVGDNRLLAGYLAHEFLTKGTLLGEKWDPAHGAHVLPPRVESSGGNSRKQAAGVQVQADQRAKLGAYAEVAHLLKTDGIHIPGIVNPTQLGGWIQM